MQLVFDRHEIKYLLDRKQRECLREVLACRMQTDQYGHSTVRSVYYDTPDYRLIRRSLEKPVYKEKLRVRSYCWVSGDDQVFVELKKKYRSIVYKRRVLMPDSQALTWLQQGMVPPQLSQIAREIEYFRQYYAGLLPTMFISAERDAYFDPEGSDLRITLDENILARADRLSLTEEVSGKPLLPAGYVLMEVKTARALPLWMTSFLSRQKIYPTSFSKYGTAYRNLILGTEGPALTPEQQVLSLRKDDAYENLGVV